MVHEGFEDHLVIWCMRDLRTMVHEGFEDHLVIWCMRDLRTTWSYGA